MKKIFVIGMYLGNRIQNHSGAIDQDHDRDHPFHISAEDVLG
jgi:hypothetical protein